MKKYSAVILLLCISLLLSCNDKPQNRLPVEILAGQKQGEGIYYHNVQPDDSIIFSASQNDTVIRTIDINSDGTDDFRFVIYNFPDPVSGYYSASLAALNQNELLCTIAYQDSYLDTLAGQEIIDRSGYWKKNSGFMLYEGWDTGQNLSWSWGYWIPPQESFAGVKVIDGSDTLYGWINIEHQLDGIHALIIKDCACTGRYLE